MRNGRGHKRAASLNKSEKETTKKNRGFKSKILVNQLKFEVETSEKLQSLAAEGRRVVERFKMYAHQTPFPTPKLLNKFSKNNVESSSIWLSHLRASNSFREAGTADCVRLCRTEMEQNME